MTDANDLRGGEFIVPPITPEQATAARRVTAAHARDAGDLAMLLEALDLGAA